MIVLWMIFAISLKFSFQNIHLLINFLTHSFNLICVLHQHSILKKLARLGIQLIILYCYLLSNATLKIVLQILKFIVTFHLWVYIVNLKLILSQQSLVLRINARLLILDNSVESFEHHI